MTLSTDTRSAVALEGMAASLGRIEELLRPLPDDVAEVRVSGLFEVDTRLLLARFSAIVDLWLTSDESKVELVDQLDQAVRDWIAETNR